MYATANSVYVPALGGDALVVSFGRVPTDLGPEATAEEAARFRRLRSLQWDDDGEPRPLPPEAEAELAAYNRRAEAVAATARTPYCRVRPVTV